MKFCALLAASTAFIADSKVVEVIDAGAKFTVEYSVEDGDLLLS